MQQPELIPTELITKWSCIVMLVASLICIALQPTLVSFSLCGLIIVLLPFIWLLSGPQSWDKRVGKLRSEGLYPPVNSGSDADVIKLIQANKRIFAIRLYRDIHKVSLKTAKEAVDDLGRGITTQAHVSPRPSAPDAEAEITRLIEANQKIAASKRYRELHGVSLKEAKDAVEQIERDLSSR
jgi:ribosomal protein L7/L12